MLGARMRSRRGAAARRPVSTLILADRAGGGSVASAASFSRTGTGATYFDSIGVLQPAAANTARFDWGATPISVPAGLLMEPARTNWANSRYTGAVAGTPGTMPTGMSITKPSTITASVVQVTVEDGMPVLDIRFQGTPTANGTCTILLIPNQTAAATQGQRWSVSTFARVAAGSSAGTSAWNFQIGERTSTGTSAQNGNTAFSSTPTTAALRTQRYSASRTFAQATAAYILPSIFFSVSNGVPVDITVRLGGTMVERSSAPGSVILTPEGGHAATAQAADMLTCPVSGLGSPGSTLVVRAVVPAAQVGGSERWTLMEASDGTANNKVAIAFGLNSTTAYAQVVNGGTLTESALGAFLPGGALKVSLAFTSTGVVASINGQAAVTLTTAVPSGLTTVSVGGFHGHLLRAEVHRTAMDSAQVAAVPTAVRGMWIWDTVSMLNTQTTRDNCIAVCQAASITDIYLYAPSAYFTSQAAKLASFMVQAKAAGFAVWGMDGAREYFSDMDGPAAYYACGDDMIAWNAAHPEAPFVGFSGDVEPNDLATSPVTFHNGIADSALTTEQAADRDAHMQDWLTMHETMRDKMHAAGLKYSAAMPDWPDNYFNEPVYVTWDGTRQRVLDVALGLMDDYIIMSYNTTPSNVLTRVAGEVATADAIGVSAPRIVVGMETHPGVGSGISYADTTGKNSKAVVLADMAQLCTSMSHRTSFAGMAIHDYEGWAVMPA
jgi:hypothetical protein